jgi:hypothetical protein
VNEHLAGARQYSEYGKDTIREPWRSIVFDMHVWRDHLPADEFHGYSVDAYAKLKPIFLRGSYSDVFDLLQWILRRPGCPRVFSRQISMVLDTCRAGYRLTEDGKTFMPIASEEDAEVARRAFAALNTNQFGGARKHLVSAAERLTAGDAPGGVRECMQAVESVARVITEKKHFADALKVLETKWKIHPALKDAFSKLYGYTSAEQGIRHPLVDDQNASVDEADALFMFGACSAFVTYLVEKSAAKST